MTGEIVVAYNLTLEYNFTIWVLYFFAYAFVGLLWESGYVSVRKRKWTNSGFLNGPAIPVYGFSMIAVLAAIRPFENNLIAVYFASAIMITLIEYVTSWLMEVFFHARWWDYSKVPLNLNGRVALPISAFWGVGVLVIVKVIHPLVSRAVLHLAALHGIFGAIVLLVLFAFDFGFTLANVLAFGAATKRIGDVIEDKKQELRERSDATLESAKNWLDTYRTGQDTGEKVPRLNYVQRRLLHGFPNLKVHGTDTSAKEITALADVMKRRRKQDK
ncbi:hypothetical protein FC82_GL002757 [Secundilactobacillus collinoides DSM 20515 = JCM 1123]|uniref:ABC transporter permease n=1 Tax=Secundilactobacillus collinoides DSM 20515 = JCM 1123 TaxID=1423733 RepID=A0A0R2B5W4_SECCO|nr:hypothetical protein FC82_GL002757 [Secundilactobacillus collinoides DSM 20515 = JCM 1123]